MSRWLAAAALLGFSGCAFTLDGPDSNRPRNRPPTCDTTKALVALDGVMATALGIAALSAASSSAPEVALAPLALGALYLGGAVSGNRAVDRCKAAMDDYVQSYGDERMVMAPDDDDDEDRSDRNGKSRGTHLLPRSGQPTQKPQQVPPPYSYPGPQPQPQPQQPYSQPPYADAPTQPAQAQPAPTQTQPAQTKPAQPQPAQGKSKPAPADDDDDWTDFWREVP